MFEQVFTLDEVSQHLRVPIDLLLKEIAAGRLHAWSFEGLFRIPESALEQFKKDASRAATAKAPVLGGQPILEDLISLQSIPGFEHCWPKRQSQPVGESLEKFTNAQQGTVRYLGKDYSVKLGFTNRDAAGLEKRTRAVVFIDRYPTVEFAGSGSSIGLDDKMASIIKDRSNKHVSADDRVPEEYEQDFMVGPYRQVVDGPGAAYGLAVICAPADLQTMVRHALIRYTFRQQRV